MRSDREPSLCDHCIHAYEVEGGSAGMSGPNGPIDVKQRYCPKPPPNSKNPDIEGRAIHFGGYQECEYYEQRS